MTAATKKPGTRGRRYRGTADADLPTNDFGKLVHRFWQKSDMSQAQCADALGIGTRTFQRWLRGVEPVPLMRQIVIQRLEENHNVRVPKKLKT